MKEEDLQLLQRCYAESREPVLLMDEDWKVVWSIHNPGIGYLPAMLGVQEDSWESCNRTLLVGEDRWECSLVCNRQDGVRIATLHRPERYTVPMDTGVISSAFTSVNAACALLHGLGPDSVEPIRTITGSCIKIYRMCYLQRELERRQAGIWRREVFVVRNALISIKEKIEKVLGDLADVKMHICEERLCLKADVDAFAAAVLSAVVLCYRVPEKRQKLEIVADKAGSSLLLTISMTPTPEDRRNLESIPSGFGTTEGEQMLLEAFCKEYDGRWMQNAAGEGGTVSCRIELPVADAANTLVFNSPAERSESRFFNKYEVLLARIHFRGIF